jgi:hydroxyacylglutathione hydrolase
MLLERIVSVGLAHYSYLVGDRNQAIVIDPRRDVDVYINMAHEAGMRIAQVLETHRNEDYFVGSMELAARTGAGVWHADPQMEYRYGQPVVAGQRWKAGRLELQAISTPGHTPGSMSYLLYDPTKAPWMLFSGDALFAGEVGRIDLLGKERAAEMAGLLYDSIFGRMLPLGDGIVLCPAHGSGSVCGEAIAERVWTTIGLEKKHNVRLAASGKEQFISQLLKSQPPDRPPYFSRVEEANLAGEPVLGGVKSPRPMDAARFSSLSDKAQVLDIRQELAFSAAHVPGSLSIWQDGLASFAGWFLSYDRPVLLVAEGNASTISEAVRTLMRLGFDDIAGFLAGGMLSWHMAGLASSCLKTIIVQGFCHLLDQGREVFVLDVRSKSELLRDGKIDGAHSIPLTMIADRSEEVPKDRDVYIFCGSGRRSMLAASFLEARGWKRLSVILGGIAGWKSRRCPVRI